MYEFHSPDILHVVGGLAALRRHALRDRDALHAAHPYWPLARDARLTAYAKVLNAVNGAELSLTFLGQHLLDPDWWTRSARPRPAGHTEYESVVKEYSQFTKVGFVQGLFSAVESAFRVFLRAVDPAACNGSTDAFENVYTCLLKNKLSRQLPRAEEVLNLARLVRNTVHNNGVYFHKRATTARAVYRGTTYEFTHGRPIEFVDWAFVIDVSNDVISVVTDVVTDSVVSNVGSPMIDPFST